MAAPQVRREVEAAYEEFEGGIMVWRGDTREIYVFYDDGTASYFLEASTRGWLTARRMPCRPWTATRR